MSWRWIAENLVMGYDSRVSQARSWVESNLVSKVVALNHKLQKLQDEG